MSEKFVDPVVADVHAARAAMLRSAGGDIAELMRQVACHQQSSNRRIIREPLRKRTELAHAREAAAASAMSSASSAPTA